MRIFLIAVPIILALPACSTRGVNPLPAPPTAGQSVLDEKALLAVELAYRAEVSAIRLYVINANPPPSTKQNLATIDNRAYLAVLAARNAYAAANSFTYSSAIEQAMSAIADIQKIIK